MAKTPPDKLPVWDTGINNTSDPGAAKQAAGWIVNEVPSSGHLNWLLNRNGGWADWYQDLVVPQALQQNTDWTTNTPWSDIAADTVRVQYLPEMNHWYAAAVDISAGDIWVYDSPDGVTWSAGNAIRTAGGTSFSQFATDGTNVGIVGEYQFYLTLDGLASGFTNKGTIDTLSDLAAGLVWDTTNSVWVAVLNSSGGQGEIYTAPGLGTVWTSRFGFTDASAATGAAIDPSGRLVVPTDGNRTYWTSDSTGSYLFATSSSYRNVMYSDALGLFVFGSDASSLVFSNDGTTFKDTGYDVRLVVTTPDFVFTVGDQGDGGAVRVFTSATDQSNFDSTLCGYWERSTDNNLSSEAFAGAAVYTVPRAFFTGDGNKLVWAWDTTSKQAICRYK